MLSLWDKDKLQNPVATYMQNEIYKITQKMGTLYSDYTKPLNGVAI